MTIHQKAIEYIESHMSIKDCLKKGILNYSSLARLIKKESGLRAKDEAIIISARRHKEKIEGDEYDKKVLELFRKSEIEIKNRIAVVRLDKPSLPDYLTDLEKDIKRRKDVFFAIEGTKTITVIVQDKNVGLLKNKFRRSLDSVAENLAMVVIDSPGIEKTAGAISYLTRLFFENGINIVEMMSCHTDTILIVEKDDVAKAMKMLSF